MISLLTIDTNYLFSVSFTAIAASFWWCLRGRFSLHYPHRQQELVYLYFYSKVFPVLVWTLLAVCYRRLAGCFCKIYTIRWIASWVAEKREYSMTNFTIEQYFPFPTIGTRNNASSSPHAVTGFQLAVTHTLCIKKVMAQAVLPRR